MASKYKEKDKKVNQHTIVRNTCMELNCSINFHLEFYKMFTLSGQKDSVDQDQTPQTVQSDIGFALYFVKNITLKWQHSGFNNIFNFFFSAGYGLI